MSNNILTPTVKTIMIVLMILAALAINTKAQPMNEQIPVIKENSVKSIIMGIRSDIPGIKKQCIYYAGMFKISDAADDLIAQLKVEKDSRTRALIGFALFKIGNENGMKAIYKASQVETNKFALHMFNSLIYQYCLDKNSVLVINY